MLSLINRHQSFMHFKFEDKVRSLHLIRAEKSGKAPGSDTFLKRKPPSTWKIPKTSLS